MKMHDLARARLPDGPALSTAANIRGKDNAGNKPAAPSRSK
jgi:hypothetical protein